MNKSVSVFLAMLSILFLSYAQFSLPSYSAEVDYLKAAINEYYKGHYRLARAQLEEAIVKNPKNQIAHYFLALTMAESHENKSALKEYETCYKIDPNSSCGIKAKLGIEQYKKFEHSNLEENYNAIRQERRSSTEDRSSIQIDKKVEESIESNKAQAKKIMEDAKKEVERIQAQAEQDINSLPRLKHNGYWRSQMTQQIREQSKERIKGVRDKAKSQSEQLEKDSALKVETFENIKQGLHQGLQKTSKKGTSLAPEGTNAYVRNYEHKK